MKVSVSDLSPTQKKLQVEIAANRVKKELDKRYRELAKSVRLKGFRPGKVPRTILQSYYGKSVEGEVSNQFIQESFRDALKEVEVKPLAEADVDEMEFKKDGTFSYSAMLEVAPPFDLEEYKGIEVTADPIAVTDQQIDAELAKARENHAELQTIEQDQAVEQGLTAVVDLMPTVDGEVFDKGKADDYMLEIGKNSLHPEFDQHLVGRKIGETATFELDYPEEATNTAVAGKRVHFAVTIKELKRKVLPDLDDDFAKEAGDHETLDDLRAKIREDLLQAREKQVQADIHQQMIEKLIDAAPFELSSKAVDREVDRLVGQFQQQFQAQGIQVDTAAFDTPEVRAEYRPQAEKNIRWQLISERIAELEDIELSAQEQEQIFEQAARMFRVPKEKVESDYADSQLVEQLKAGKLQDKIFQRLDEHAVVTEKSPEQPSTSEE